MTIRLGSVELASVQQIRTGEPRRIVELAIPGRKGGVLQDLGRPLVAIRIDGIFVGEKARESLESLRKAHADASPLSFAADVLAGVDFTDVIIEALDVQEVAGFTRRYRYAIALREHIEEAVPTAVELAAVDAGVEADAASWADGAVGTTAVIDDVGSLPDAVAENPAILDHMDSADLKGAIEGGAGGLSGGALKSIVDAVGGPDSPLGGVVNTLSKVEVADVVAAYQAIQDPSKLGELLGKSPEMLERLGMGDLAAGMGEKLDELTGGDFKDVIDVLVKIDPEKVVVLVEDLRSAKNLGEFMEKLAGGGINLLEDLTGVDLGAAGPLLKAVAGGADFLKKLSGVANSGTKLVATLRGYDPLASLRALAEARPT